VCHALTGDAHVAGGIGPGQPTPGWWDALVGPGRALDTERFLVVCANVPGGCQGSTGPASTDPATGRPYGSAFPVVSVRDMVRTQAALADHLGVDRWLTVIGGSMGGMQVLEWGVMHPDRVRSLVPIATAAAASAQQIAWGSCARAAIALDPRWRGGDYHDAGPGDGPAAGLALARMISQVTYRSDDVFADRFGREVVEPLDGFSLWQRFEVERYLEYHGAKLVARFDANSFLVLSKAMDLHDVGRGRGGVPSALGRVRVPGAGRRHPIGHPVPAGPAAGHRRRAGRRRRPRRLRRDRQPPRPRRLPPGHRPGGGGAGPVPRDRGEAPMTDRPAHIETTAVQAGRSADETSLAPVLYATTTFRTPTVEDSRRMATRQPGEDRFYSRYGNPTVSAFEEAVAALEGAEAARAYASGMGAITGVVLALCSTGDHVVAQRQLYGGTRHLFEALCPRMGIDVTLVDGTRPGAFAAAVQPGRTVLVYAETPANPRLDLVDLDELGAIEGPFTAVDSTFATPVAQRPIEHGVDLVVHSATKGLSGHNDASLGVVAGSRDLVAALWPFAVLQGANASPYDALNGLRGLRTLPVRVARQSASAQQLAEALEGHPAVAEVRYPGLDSHPQRDLAKRQMDLPGGILAFDAAGGLEAGARFVESLRIAQMAPSLGGPETLVTHPASSTHAQFTDEELAVDGITPGTVRISVGLEHPDDLVADVLQALG
ncbi:MAG TPA: homoserine O-acetyltransferase, partial [Acidimicrobiales bacterium]